MFEEDMKSSQLGLFFLGLLCFMPRASEVHPLSLSPPLSFSLSLSLSLSLIPSACYEYQESARAKHERSDRRRSEKAAEEASKLEVSLFHDLNPLLDLLWGLPVSDVLIFLPALNAGSRARD